MHKDACAALVYFAVHAPDCLRTSVQQAAALLCKLLHICAATCCFAVQVAAQQELQQAVQRERQKGAFEQQAAVNQLNLQLQQATQQLADARKDAHTAQLDVDSLNK